MIRRLTVTLTLLLAGCGEVSDAVDGASDDTAAVRIEAADDVCWSGSIGDATREGCGDKRFGKVEGVGGIFSANVQKSDDNRKPVTIVLEVDGREVDRTTTKAPFGVAQVVND